MLEVKNIETGYNKKQVLYDVSLKVHDGEIVSIIGPNGAGKSTILKAICGALPLWSGDVVFDGKLIRNNSIAQNIKSGITIAPQGNRVFDELTVKDNLELGGYILPKKILQERIEQTFEIFSVLKKRLRQLAGKLSGGEQQMLAIARAFIPKPKFLLLDEPSLGLAPNLLDDVFEKVTELNAVSNTSLLIVEQNVKEILKISHRTYSIKLGKVAFEGKSKELINNTEKLKELFL